MNNMSSCTFPLQFFLVLIIFIHLISSAYAQYFPYTSCNNTAGNFTDNSSYQSDLKTLFSSITSTNNINYSFFNASSTNQNSEESPHVIGLCRGDLRTAACQACLSACASNLTRLCPSQKQALLYLENCTLRYSNESLLGQGVTEPSYAVWNPDNVTNPDPFNQALLDLLGNLRTEAASGGSLRKFASGNTVSSNSYPIYAFMQCTPDLSEQQCLDCLIANVGALTEGSLGRLGAKVKLPSCISQFETSPFLDPVEPLPPPPSSGKKSSTTKIAILIALPVTILVVLIVCIIAFMKKRKKKPLAEADTIGEMGAEQLQFDLTTIKLATDEFADDKKLGQGGFGAVYMGKLPSGQEIAVKRLSINSSQGELEFKNEVMLLAKLEHRNLVQLLGFCLEGTERLLIYELIPNSSLDHFIFDLIKRQQLDWERRHKIIIGIARGLLYLHEDSRLRIIHRDLKASNILLDANMNPKISDFGMAKLFAMDQTQADTSRIVGTYGYMAPEYAMHGNFSVKSDVFSFGVLILEIVCGQRNNCFAQGENMGNLLTYVWKNWREGLLEKIIDPTLKSESIAEIACSIHVGLLCVQENIANRPTMASLLLMLNSNSTTLTLPSQPAFFLESNVEPNTYSTQEHHSARLGVEQLNNESKSMSKNEVSITELHPR